MTTLIDVLSVPNGCQMGANSVPTPESWLAMLSDVVKGMDEAQREALVSQTLDAFDQAGVELAGCLLREFNAARWWR